MIKPDAVRKNSIGGILQMINEAGFRIIAMKYTKLSKEKAGEFYAVHKERPFYHFRVVDLPGAKGKEYEL